MILKVGWWPPTVGINNHVSPPSYTADESLPYAFQAVQVRLISFFSRECQIMSSTHIKNYEAYVRNNPGRWEKGLCDALIVHIHGGGFVAQSSQSHEVCLSVAVCWGLGTA